MDSKAKIVTCSLESFMSSHRDHITTQDFYMYFCIITSSSQFVSCCRSTNVTSTVPHLMISALNSFKMFKKTQMSDKHECKQKHTHTHVHV